MYNPPHDDYGITTYAYKLGQEAAKDGLKLKDNPFKLSGHERDTTVSDILNEVWEKGFDDYFKKEENEETNIIHNFYPE